MCIYRNMEARSCNHCCCGRTMSITQIVCVCVCVFVDLGMQYAVRKRHIVICGLPRSTTFFRIIS